ncbi:hypothetical protein ACJX0J_036607 [Zea mays]
MKNMYIKVKMTYDIYIFVGRTLYTQLKVREVKVKDMLNDSSNEHHWGNRFAAMANVRLTVAMVTTALRASTQDRDIFHHTDAQIKHAVNLIYWLSVDDYLILYI